MSVKTYLTRYCLVTIGAPLMLFAIAMLNIPSINMIITITLIFLALMILVFSNSILQFMFGARDESYIDGEFVIKINCVLLVIFLARYALTYFLDVLPLDSEMLMYIIAFPIWILFFIPILKDYSINKRTVQITLIVSFLVIYVALPFVLTMLCKVMPSGNLDANGVYYNYIGYTYFSNKGLYMITNLLKINLSGNVIMVLQVVMNFFIWCLMYLPYIVISAVWTDEMTYLERGSYIRTKSLLTLVFILLIISVICMILSSKGIINTDYIIRHNL